MELIVCEQKLNMLFPYGISRIIVDLAYGYDHPSRHHAGCNIRKFKNDKLHCNCLFYMNHSDNCKFLKGYLLGEEEKKNAVTSGEWIHQLVETTKYICNCSAEIPEKIICNTCFTSFKYCCGYKCMFCFICDVCGVGHSYVNLWKGEKIF